MTKFDQEKEYFVRKKRYTEQQIALALKQAKTGTAVAEVIRKMGISEATFYTWKKKYSGMGANGASQITSIRRRK